MVALYNATGGSNWRFRHNWLSNRPLSEWVGIRTNDEGRVRWLDLHNNNLTGSIPSKLGELIELEWLALYDNNLTGSIPSSLGELANLEFFQFSDNSLTGSIPSKLGELG